MPFTLRLGNLIPGLDFEGDVAGIRVMLGRQRVPDATASPSTPSPSTVSSQANGQPSAGGVRIPIYVYAAGGALVVVITLLALRK